MTVTFLNKIKLKRKRQFFRVFFAKKFNSIGNERKMRKNLTFPFTKEKIK